MRLRPLHSGAMAQALLLSSVACAPAPPTSVASPVQEGMFAHFALARDLRSHAVNGDLDSFRITAVELARTEETWGLPPGSSRGLEEVRLAARSGSEARTHAEAAQAAARVAAACGACHLAADATLGSRFQVAAPLMEDPATRHVNFLAWVSRLLWDGLVGPSDRLWHAGAAALAASDGVPPPRGGRAAPDAVAAAAAELREMGSRAAAADDPDERARILGRVWQACADCHAREGVR